jgi:hypothetical protein
MIDDIAKGIKDLIDSDDGALLRAYIGSRYYYMQAPQETTFPFFVFTSLSDVNMSTFTEEIDYTHWTFSIWVNNPDPFASGQLRDITRAVKALFDGAEMMVGSSLPCLRSYDELNLLSYDQLNLLTYDELDYSSTRTYNEYVNFGTVYIRQDDIKQTDRVLHRSLEYEIWIMKNKE